MIVLSSNRRWLDPTRAVRCNDENINAKLAGHRKGGGGETIIAVFPIESTVGKTEFSIKFFFSFLAFLYRMI